MHSMQPKIPNTDTHIAILWNTDTEYWTDFKITEKYQKTIPTSNTDTDSSLLCDPVNKFKSHLDKFWH